MSSRHLRRNLTFHLSYEQGDTDTVNNPSSLHLSIAHLINLLAPAGESDSCLDVPPEEAGLGELGSEVGQSVEAPVTRHLRLHPLYRLLPKLQSGITSEGLGRKSWT